MNEHDAENQMVVGSYYEGEVDYKLNPLAVYKLLLEIAENDEQGEYKFFDDALTYLFFGVCELKLKLTKDDKRKVGDYCIQNFEPELDAYLIEHHLI